ncbi:hypothetical protein BROUX41_001976 [Berkeleyomyces rouxiae]|uniref:uncharacterized protein n=1 Tax=Berkeleyomyces rouxiae TaxID=2035830 RepID=UPI003B80F1C7
MSEAAAPREKRAGRNNNNRQRNRANKGRQPANVSESEHAANAATTSGEPPKTPQKNNSSQQKTTGQDKSQSRSQLKQSKNRSRSNKNLQTSPQPQTPHNNRSVSGRQTTPPQSAGLPRSSSTPFAGSTFHASPAPSSLPMPKFLAKKPTTPEAELSRSVSEKTESPAKQTLPPAAHAFVASPPLHNPGLVSDSPLEFIFKADRAEKERAKHSTPNGPGAENRYLDKPHTVPRMSSHQTTNSPPSDSPALLSAIFNSVQASPSVNKVMRSGGDNTGYSNKYYKAMASELDNGYAHQPVGSSFARPFTERLREAQSPRRDNYTGPTPSPPLTQNLMHTPPPLPSHIMPTPPRASMQTPPHNSHYISDDASAALKAYLFNIPTPETPSTNVNPMKRNGDFSHSPPVHHAHGFHMGYHHTQHQGGMSADGPIGLQSGFHASLPQKSVSTGYPVIAGDTLALEDRLRQMLKISPSSSA